MKSNLDHIIIPGNQVVLVVRWAVLVKYLTCDFNYIGIAIQT